MCYRMRKVNQSAIVFGTDGWRARMGSGFTFRKVRLFAQAYAHFLQQRQSRGHEPAVVVNYDTRFLSREFARAAANILSRNRIRVWLPERDAPYPAIALAIVRNELQGGFSFTASFNPLVDNGIKVFNARGAPALPSQTLLLEREIARLEAEFVCKPQYGRPGWVTTFDPRPAYLKYLSAQVRGECIRSAGVKVLVDNLYGTARDYLDRFLNDQGIDAQAIHNFADANFGNILPSCSGLNLEELSRLVVERKAAVGLACDIDGDRFGIIDERGRYVAADQVLPALIEYLITVRLRSGDVIKSLATTDAVDAVAARHSRRVLTTPVGFKYVADLLAQKRAFIGVESTNGAAVNGEIVGKDGILSSLLIAEMVAHHRTPLGDILDHFWHRFNRRYKREIQLAKTIARKKRFAGLLHGAPPDVGGRRILHVQLLDGIKFIFENAWLLLRESGTRSVFRIYAESGSAAETGELIRWGRDIIA